MKRRTTIAAGWVWLAIGYGLSTLIGLSLALALFLSGCQDAGMTPVLPFHGLCVAGVERDAVVQSGTIAMLALMCIGTLLAGYAAASHMNRGLHSSLQAVALLTTTLVAATVATLIVAKALPFGGVNALVLLVACLAAAACIIVVGPLAAWIAGLIERRRIHV